MGSEKKYTVRASVLDMPIDMWVKFHDNYTEGPFEGTAIDFLETIGLPSGLGTRYNEEEKAFFDEIYGIWRATQNQNTAKIVE